MGTGSVFSKYLLNELPFTEHLLCAKIFRPTISPNPYDLIPTSWVRCCYYPPFYRWQWLRNMPRVTLINSRGELQTLWLQSLHSLPLMGLLLCTSWWLIWSKNILSKILSFHMQSWNWRGFLKCFEHSWKLRKTNSQEETQEWVSVSNSHTGIRKSGQRGGGQWTREVSIFCQLRAYK